MRSGHGKKLSGTSRSRMHCWCGSVARSRKTGGMNQLRSAPDCVSPLCLTPLFSASPVNAKFPIVTMPHTTHPEKTPLLPHCWKSSGYLALADPLFVQFLLVESIKQGVRVSGPGPVRARIRSDVKFWILFFQGVTSSLCAFFRIFCAKYIMHREKQGFKDTLSARE
jgi:hypothetical protein